MQTLEQLQSGKLKGVKKLKLSEGLTEFPREIFSLADTLEILDMTDNNLSRLPDDFGTLKQLKILFLSNNRFSELPKSLSQCPELSMIGFRNNQIETIEEDVLPLSTRWLILTENKLVKLPNSIGKLKLLQKLMLSGNQLVALPETLSGCHNLELIRIAANCLEKFPKCLLTLPKLAWMAFGGNPFAQQQLKSHQNFEEIRWEDITIGKLLGEGTSGEIYKALYHNNEVAVKVFKSEMTSDGLPQDEMKINLALGKHVNLIDTLGVVKGHVENKNVLMLQLIGSEYFTLGLPPTLETCSRDVYPISLTLSLEMVKSILLGMSQALAYVHKFGIIHGDFYAHNILVEKRGHAVLGDFGGASFCNPKNENRLQIERIEVRAFGYLIEELLGLVPNNNIKNKHNRDKEKLESLKERCLKSENQKRPLFKEIEVFLKEFE